MVVVDNERGAASAVKHLVSAGHRRIACVAHASGRFTSETRQKGYTHGLRESGLKVDPALIVSVEDEVDVCVEALQELAAMPDPPTALFTTNSRTTKAILKAQRLLGRRTALVGFDDFDLAELMDPPTTTVSQDAWMIGEAAGGSAVREDRRDAGPGTPPHPRHASDRARFGRDRPRLTRAS